ncbi:uncharacterized protein OCT59_009215 [Rhizophagus irregularis]|uniref:Uncharacterized protein n=1 Tax=Rhizophagus irregularis (strain DAOM 181602 / DAOM 197198 / MUCL 43194) TaxID=747089 RepID=U9T5G5_RHIID|nr:hypothetical protein GLOIN_2v1768984 [Rhizophagus irregularis DAOM 181602=DAOM 197198]POG76388.1 hypothetical protein GLOIN_2v1768984 [Rhizophagus irregularis DAOM 181602=DAOM 197198]UZO17882.1 hypothetical protein OCT59_009215 [Rhizophagus irregularis]CAG8690577.1 15405_t:CDS:2 [Rhizophagus irregularis]|eukprot:XP_025183254.1 hypothetical protein GLOIN_2v1768984 [Rhizophagus irregularis DAOM 181602=DAOM 197198]
MPLNLRIFVLFHDYFFLILCLTIFAITPVVQAADVRSFCKCVCDQNSTIVPLRINQTCSDCNLAFCKENTSKEDCDIPTCFQRDSYKDEVIVYFYIIITSGLLLIALTKPYIERWWRRTNPPHTYTSMPNS